MVNRSPAAPDKKAKHPITRLILRNELKEVFFWNVYFVFIK
jgi:hypothetical protein